MTEPAFVAQKSSSLCPWYAFAQKSLAKADVILPRWNWAVMIDLWPFTHSNKCEQMQVIKINAHYATIVYCATNVSIRLKFEGVSAAETHRRFDPECLTIATGMTINYHFIEWCTKHCCHKSECLLLEQEKMTRFEINCPVQLKGQDHKSIKRKSNIPVSTNCWSRTSQTMILISHCVSTA